MEQKVTVVANKEENRLYLKMFGNYSSMEDAENALVEIEKGVSQLKPGFTVINDISDLIICSEEVARKAHEGMKIIEKYGAVQSVRVVSGGDSIKAFKTFSSILGRDVFVYYAKSVEEAKKILDGKK